MVSQSHDELLKRIERDLLDSYDEELELEIEDRHSPEVINALGTASTEDSKAHRIAYFRELFRLVAAEVHDSQHFAGLGGHHETESGDLV